MFEKKPVMGLDIGQYSIKLSVIEPDNKTIYNLWKREILPDRISYDQSLKGKELEIRLLEILKDYKKKNTGGFRSVSASIQGENTFCGYIEFPHMSNKELEFAVPSVAHKYIPFPLEQVGLFYVPVPHVHKDKKKSAVFFVAAQKKSVKELDSILTNANIKISGLEVPVFPLVRNFSANHKPADEQFYALVHTGFRLTHIIIVKDGFPYYAREFSLAGRDFTYAFQMGFQNSWDSAEKYKLNYDANSREIHIEPFLTRWLDEVKKSLDFFTKQFKDVSPVINKLYLSGGTSLLKGLDLRLSEYINIPVTIDSIEQLKWKSEGNPPLNFNTFNIATGLGLEH